MSLITRYFASDYDFEKGRAKWLDGQLTLSLTREREANAEIRRLNTRIEKILMRHADAMQEFAGKKGKFTLDAEPPKEEPDTILYSDKEEQKFEHYAREMRDQDIATAITNGHSVQDIPSLDEYIQRFRKSPEEVFVG